MIQGSQPDEKNLGKLFKTLVKEFYVQKKRAIKIFGVLATSGIGLWVKYIYFILFYFIFA